MKKRINTTIDDDDFDPLTDEHKAILRLLYAINRKRECRYIKRILHMRGVDIDGRRLGLCLCGLREMGLVSYTISTNGGERRWFITEAGRVYRSGFDS